MTPTVPLLSTLESYLKLTTSREQAISANMANVDTPGYRTRDINFESELNRVMSWDPPCKSADGSETVQLLPRNSPGSGLDGAP